MLLRQYSVNLHLLVEFTLENLFITLLICFINILIVKMTYIIYMQCKYKKKHGSEHFLFFIFLFLTLI